MNYSSETTNGQAHLETFDPTDKGIGAGWSSFLARYSYDAFATLTFKTPRRDPFDIVKVFDAWLFRWHATEAAARGELTITTKPSSDAYGRRLPDKVKYRGPFINRWKRRHGRPIYCVGIEPHQSGALHLHAVIKFQQPYEMIRSVGWRIWADPHYSAGMDKGWARIEPPASQGDVLGYCSKYVTKGGELVLSRSFNAQRGTAKIPQALLATA